MNGFSDAFLLEAERHAAWGAAQLEALTAFLPDDPQVPRAGIDPVTLPRTLVTGAA
ncbi:hypothetical protein [Streptomyces sp. NPDC086989]|uniref:hypothetical protein n=1 Tax=Streptomyces sp. NPDC086989 TaxID=3365764 RepID=UPI0038110CED